MKIFDRYMVVQLIFIIFGGILGIIYLPLLWISISMEKIDILNNVFVNSILGAIIFFLLSLVFGKKIIKYLSKIEKYLFSKNPFYILMGTIGMIIGLVLAILISIVLFRTPSFITNTLIPALLMIFFGYFGFILGTTKLNDWNKIFNFSLKKATNSFSSNAKKEKSYKILDTNILIDGRIYKLIKTGFLEGTLLVPKFVLYELQYIADSSDSAKRVRGRRGLDILNKLQTEKIMPIEMTDKDYKEISEVDTKLIQLAKNVDGEIVTNDYNLNKVIKFQKVKVLNINELASALKPSYIPGEYLDVMILKKGTERNQGVAYLDDGTMVVVEEGKNYLNKRLTVEVTSSIQTDAGKMIFAKITNK